MMIHCICYKASVRAEYFLHFNNSRICGEILVSVNAFKPPSGLGCCPCKAVALLLLTFCLLLLPLWESVIVLCFAVRHFMSILVLQSS